MSYYLFKGVTLYDEEATPSINIIFKLYKLQYLILKKFKSYFISQFEFAIPDSEIYIEDYYIDKISEEDYKVLVKHITIDCSYKLYTKIIMLMKYCIIYNDIKYKLNIRYKSCIIISREIRIYKS
jgi:hypothetical protein